MRGIILSGLSVLALACAAQAQDTPPAATAPTPQTNVVAGRQAAFNLSAVTLGAMKSSIDAGASPETQRFASRALVRWAQALPGQFPAGTGEADLPGQTRAKADIWSDRAGFEQKAADYATAAQALNDMARANDAPGFAAQWAVVRETCNACHATYRVNPPA